MGRAVIAIIRHPTEDKILLGRKRSDSEKYLSGKWHVLGETLRDGESDYAALVRCAEEEAEIYGLRVGRYVAEGTTPSGNSLGWYECFSPTDGVAPRSDIEVLMWSLRQNVPDWCEGRAETMWPDEVKAYFA